MNQKYFSIKSLHNFFVILYLLYYHLLLPVSIVTIIVYCHLYNYVYNCPQVRQSFCNGENNYYTSYLLRTLLELGVIMSMLAWLLLEGVPTMHSLGHTIPCRWELLVHYCTVQYFWQRS